MSDFMVYFKQGYNSGWNDGFVNGLLLFLIVFVLSVSVAFLIWCFKKGK